MQRLSIFMILTITTNFCFGQRLTEENVDADIVKIHNLIVFYIADKDKHYNPARKDEVMLLLIETDSNGVVFNLHLLSDKNAVDTATSSIVRRIKPEDFGYWKFGSLKNKVINMPIYSLTYDPPAGYIKKSIVHGKNLTTSWGGVLAKPIYCGVPGETKE